MSNQNAELIPWADCQFVSRCIRGYRCPEFPPCLFLHSSATVQTCFQLALAKWLYQIHAKKKWEQKSSKINDTIAWSHEGIVWIDWTWFIWLTWPYPITSRQFCTYFNRSIGKWKWFDTTDSCRLNRVDYFFTCRPVPPKGQKRTPRDINLLCEQLPGVFCVCVCVWINRSAHPVVTTKIFLSMNK